MPITVKNTAGGTIYGAVFVDGPRDVEQVIIDISTLTFADESGGEVDGNGYIIPGTPVQVFGSTGTVGALVSGSGQTAGVIFEAVKVPTTTVVDADADLDAITDFQVAVARGGLLNRDMAEDNLGRALGANELTALQLGGVSVTAT